MSVEQLQLQMGMGNLTVCGKYTVFFCFFLILRKVFPQAQSSFF